MISKIKFLLLLILTLLIISCVSLTDPSETTKGLLVLPLGQENKENLEFFGEYRVTFKSIGSNSSFTRRINPEGKYALVYFEPGSYEVSEVNFIYKSGHHGTIQKLSINFKIEHGKITILSHRFITRLFKDDDGVRCMNNSFVHTSILNKNEIKEDLSDLENFDMWSFL